MDCGQTLWPTVRIPSHRQNSIIKINRVCQYKRNTVQCSFHNEIISKIFSKYQHHDNNELTHNDISCSAPAFISGSFSSLYLHYLNVCVHALGREPTE